jgi:peptide/nickel transport system substrate-binding protein
LRPRKNKWQRSNTTSWHDEAYDKAFHAAEGELDPVKRAALFIAMNDTVVEDGVVIPVVHRPQVSAISKKLRGDIKRLGQHLLEPQKTGTGRP